MDIGTIALILILAPMVILLWAGVSVLLFELYKQIKNGGD
jgi:hypothetical protein